MVNDVRSEMDSQCLAGVQLSWAAFPNTYKYIEEPMQNTETFDWNLLWTWISIVLILVGFWVGVVEIFFVNLYGISLFLIIVGLLLLWNMVAEYQERTEKDE